MLRLKLIIKKMNIMTSNQGRSFVKTMGTGDGLSTVAFLSTRNIIFIFLILFSLNACTEKTGNNSLDSNFVEGLFYLDEEPVSIEIVDGKIAKIKHLTSGSDIQEVYGSCKSLVERRSYLFFANSDYCRSGVTEK